MTTEPLEKRRGQRIHTELPVYLKSAIGVTRDVSASGVFLWTDAACVPGETISFSVEFKRPGGKVLFICRGDVVRTEPHEAGLGVAVKITESTMQLI
jgi:hypothetical protein